MVWRRYIAGTLQPRTMTTTKPLTRPRSDVSRADSLITRRERTPGPNPDGGEIETWKTEEGITTQNGSDEAELSCGTFGVIRGFCFSCIEKNRPGKGVAWFGWPFFAFCLMGIYHIPHYRSEPEYCSVFTIETLKLCQKHQSTHVRNGIESSRYV
ncbi:hypothetical protein F4677DRAFT_191454 [Hypoxylon crocopeplum]|nr:hypothetical protein F4677DRAFT_191454 [Hypoxylon crocopeplum]